MRVRVYHGPSLNPRFLGLAIWRHNARAGFNLSLLPQRKRAIQLLYRSVVLTHLFTNGNSELHCTGPCYLQGSRTWCRTLSRDGRTGCSSGRTRHHVDPVLSLYNQNLLNLLFWCVSQYIILENFFSSLGKNF